MSLMRKKPVPVEARGPIVEPEMVTTAHGRVRAEAGDYVLRDPKTGDTWPIKPDIFAATYEPVTEDRRTPSPSRDDDHETFCKAADERATAAEAAPAEMKAKLAAVDDLPCPDCDKKDDRIAELTASREKKGPRPCGKPECRCCEFASELQEALGARAASREAEQYGPSNGGALGGGLFQLRRVQPSER
jgi:hypothetical protein